MSARMIHPAWCLREGCDERGWHESAEVRCNADQSWDQIAYFVVPEDERDRLADDGEVMIVRAAVVQALAGRYPTLEIRSYDVPESLEVAILTRLQARLLLAGLPGLLAMMDGEIA